MFGIRRRILAFVLIYLVVLGGIGIALYVRYQNLANGYTEVHVKEFDQRIENYRSIYLTVLDNYHTLFVSNPRISTIMHEAIGADRVKQAALRHELYGYTGEVFESLKQLNVNIFFFHLPNSIAFLRVHEPDHFGDSLRKARQSINVAQKEQRKVVAFEVGKFYNGFRTIYPIFDQQKFVGTVEIAYPFLAFKKQAMAQNPAAYGLLLKRSVVDKKTISAEKSKHYQNTLFGAEYIEDKESALTLEAQGFAKGELTALLKQNRDRITKALSEERLQGIVLSYRGVDALLVMKPVQEMGGKHVGYMVELTRKHPFYLQQWKQFLELMSVMAFLLGILLSYVYRYYRSTKLLEQYKNAIDNTLIVSKADKEGIITYANALFSKISGYSEQELIGEPHNIIRDPDMPASTFTELWSTITSKKTWQGILKNRAKDGSSYYVKSTIFPILDEHGDIIEFMGLREDVTQLIHATQNAEKLRQEAERSEMAKMEFLANMSHEIRTPLNGIMGFARLLFNADLPNENHLQAKIITEQSKTLLGIINDILDLSKIESGNLQLEKIAINPFVEFETAFSLFIPLAQEKGISYRIYIDSTISESIGIDSLRIKQVMSNLISNAIKFTPNGGEIVVEVRRVDNPHGLDRLHFGVRDTGIGIASEKIASIFTPFIQEDSSTTRHFGGTGLGLSISAKLVELFGGALVVESIKGEGSYFWFEVDVMECDRREVLAGKLEASNIGVIRSDNPHYPYVKQQLDTFHVSFIDCDAAMIEQVGQTQKRFNLLIVFDETMIVQLLEKAPYCYDRIMMIGEVRGKYPERVIVVDDYDNCPSHLYNLLLSVDLDGIQPMASKKLQRQWPGRNVLVVEDYPVNQMLIEALLEVHGIVPDLADNGKMACEMVEKKGYDLILMDVNMPVMDGVTATHNIRPYHPDLPIVALTANALSGDKERYMEEGMNGYLSKPIDPEALLEVLERYFGNHDEVTVNRASTIDEKKNVSKGELIEVARVALGLKREVIEKMFNLFFGTVDQEMQMLQKSIQEEAFPLIRSTAHTLKGSAANLRMDDFAVIAKKIEMAASEERIEECRAEYALLKETLQGITASVHD